MNDNMVEHRTEKIWIRIQQDPLKLEEAVVFVTSPRCGAINSFVGTTRQFTDGRRTLSLEYESYQPMAVKVMLALAEEVVEKWKIERVAIHHRLGEVPVSEASVTIAVSAPHRSVTFEACRYLIDELKQRVPIWKREQFDSGEKEWVRGTLPPLPE